MGIEIPEFKVIRGIESAAKKTFYLLNMYLRAERPIIYISHFDFRTIDMMLVKIKNEWGDPMEIIEYVSGVGTMTFEHKEQTDQQRKESLASLLKDTLKLLEKNLKKTRILLLKNVHKELEDSAIQSLIRQVVGRSMKEYGAVDAQTEFGVQVVIVSPYQVIPPLLERLTTYLTLGAPSEVEIFEYLKQKFSDEDVEVSDDVLKETALSMRGLSLFEIDQVVSLIDCSSYPLASKKANELILEEKRQLVQKSGLLKIVDAEPEGNESKEEKDNKEIGGLLALQEYLEDERKIFQNLVQAKKFGVMIPKGILIVGMPGCGKTLTAKLTAKKFGVPLICLDIGRLMGPFVGQSEENFRRALMTVEAAAPCVLWIDELEKAFSGVSSNGMSGGGSEVTTRLFGSFLTWMQEKRDSVYVIATANRISQLPPEFLRRGRFDEIFRVDFPDEREREDIFRVCLNHRRYSPGYNADIDMKALAAKSMSDGYCGADIEAAIGNVFKRAFLDGKIKISQEMLEKEVKALKPLKETLKEDLKELEDRMEKYQFRSASKK